jgi:hypothetical protein
MAARGYQVNLMGAGAAGRSRRPRYDHRHAGRSAVSAYAEHAPMFAALARETAREISRVDLDDTSSSLARVDAILDQMRLAGVAPETVSATLFAFGCYVGEVFVREHGAVWVETDRTPMADAAGGHPMVLELHDGSFCNPIGKVWKRLANGEEDSLAYFYKVFTEDAPRPPSRWWKLWK